MWQFGVCRRNRYEFFSINPLFFVHPGVANVVSVLAHFLLQIVMPLRGM